MIRAINYAKRRQYIFPSKNYFKKIKPALFSSAVRTFTFFSGELQHVAVKKTKNELGN